jgi:protein regulator of cytokinesis 1
MLKMKFIVQEARFQQLVDGFAALAFLHAELSLPPVPLSQPHHFPINLLPSRKNEERPGAFAQYEKALSRYITANPPSPVEMEEAASLKGLDGVEPEVGLLAWVEEMNGLVRCPLCLPVSS